MYMRFVQLKAKSNNIDILRSFYDSIALQELQKTAGCQFAGLVRSSVHSDEFISMTIWDTQETAEAYENSGVYKKLLKQCKPFLAESTEWKIQLSDKLELQYVPVQEEPVLKEYTVATQAETKTTLPEQISRMYVRIVSAKIQVGKEEEFKRIYTQEIIPALLSTKGCRYALLMESFHEREETVSLTIWDSKEDADHYEQSGKFDELVDKVKHTFSDFYRWKMALEKEMQGKIKSSEDLKVNRYELVSGKKFS